MQKGGKTERAAKSEGKREGRKEGRERERRAKRQDGGGTVFCIWLSRRSGARACMILLQSRVCAEHERTEAAHDIINYCIVSLYDYFD